MAMRSSPVHDAKHSVRWVLLTVGRELRIARYRSGMTQRQVAKRVGRSDSWLSRVEKGIVPGVPVAELMLAAASVGLKLYVKTYPAGRRPLDAPQLSLLKSFNERIGPKWRLQLEKVMPIAGDLRAVDELISTDECSCAVEAITRLVDIQGQLRPARAKQRDVHADRLILVVKATRANRRILREAGSTLRSDLPIPSRSALHALAEGRDPGGDCLIVL